MHKKERCPSKLYPHHGTPDYRELNGYCDSLQESSETANYLLSGPFCFVQTSDGKIVSVHYGPDEKPAIVNLKKAVAAAFQANFKYTEQEVEEDTLTTHVSQYR